MISLCFGIVPANRADVSTALQCFTGLSTVLRRRSGVGPGSAILLLPSCFFYLAVRGQCACLDATLYLLIALVYNNHTPYIHPLPPIAPASSIQCLGLVFVSCDDCADVEAVKKKGQSPWNETRCGRRSALRAALKVKHSSQDAHQQALRPSLWPDPTWLQREGRFRPRSSRCSKSPPFRPGRRSSCRRSPCRPVEPPVRWPLRPIRHLL